MKTVLLMAEIEDSEDDMTSLTAEVRKGLANGTLKNLRPATFQEFKERGWIDYFASRIPWLKTSGNIQGFVINRETEE